MKKLIRTLSILLIATVCTVCVALFAACGGDKGGEYATDKIYITVLDENGNAINGPTFGKQDYVDEVAQVQIQFCTLDGTCSSENAKVGADGKAEFPVSIIKTLAEAYNTDTVELHVLYVKANGYLKGESGEYGRYKISELPKNLTVNLKKAGN